MASFRAIKPAPSLAGEAGDTPSARAPVSGTTLGKRIRSVAQACHTCRQIKAKCDGARPICSHCRVKGKRCGYDGEVGQSRQAAMRARMEHLEKLVRSLQSDSAEEALQVFKQIRAADDVMKLSADYSGSDGAQSSGEEITPPEKTQSQIEQLYPGAPRAQQQPATSPTTETSTCSPPVTSMVRGGSVTASSSDGLSSTAFSPKESTHSTSDLSWGWIRLSMPNAAKTRIAINDFFGCSGKLFHLFSRPQVDNFYRIVFEDDAGVSSREKMAALCCVTAVAAVGVQYTNSDVFAIGAEVAFYDISRHCFDYLLETDSLDIVKACTLFAMYNIMGKATVSLAYVEIGLSLSRRHGLTERKPRVGISQDSWIDYRRAWRTLIFFASWLSSTLGYMSGDDFQTHKLKLDDMDVEDTPEISSVVQAEMTKICIMKAEILHMHLADKDFTVVAIEGIMKKLQDWYGRLPEPMHIANLGRQDIPDDTRRSIYHVHLLYLGAIILLYRRVASQFVRSHAVGQDHEHLWKPFERLLISNTKEAILAAKHSARILTMLRAEDGIFKRCWLVIFQSYTSCLAILHSVAQKQIHNFDPAEWEDDLHNAKQCLDILAYCGTLDPVAAKFHRKLSTMRDELDRLGQADRRALSHRQCLSNAATAPPDYLLNIPATADPARIRLAMTLLVLLCQPFGDIEDADAKACAELDVKEWSKTDPTRYEAPQLVERLEWNYECSNTSFQWDIDQLGLHGLDLKHLESGQGEVAAAVVAVPVVSACSVGVPRGVGLEEVTSASSSDAESWEEEERDRKRRCNRFLMSSQPSGWSSGDDYFF